MYLWYLYQFPYLNQYEVLAFFCFFPPDSKLFSDPTFLVHISMEYLIITSQNLKSGFAPRQSSCEEEVKLVLSQLSNRGRGKPYISVKSLLFVLLSRASPGWCYFHSGCRDTQVASSHAHPKPEVLRDT